MNQQFQQREEQLSKKDFAISQYEEFVKKLEESLKIETCEIAITYLEPSPSPEVDSILNTLLDLNARLMNVSNLIESTESVDVDEILKEKDEEIQTLKGELNVKSDESDRFNDLLNDTSEELADAVKEIARLESLVSEKVDEIGDLALEVTNKDDEIKTLQDKVDELETTVTDKKAEIESLKASNTKKK